MRGVRAKHTVVIMDEVAYRSSCSDWQSPGQEAPMRAAVETRRLTILAVLAACALALPCQAAAQTADAFLGTWKLDPSKSTYKPGPASKSSTLVIEAAGKGM